MLDLKGKRKWAAWTARKGVRVGVFKTLFACMPVASRPGLAAGRHRLLLRPADAVCCCCCGVCSPHTGMSADEAMRLYIE